MPKLHDGHVRKHKIRKMKVNLAVQILSRTVSSFIRHLTCNQYIISHDNSTATGTCMDTSTILLQLCTDIRFKCCYTCVSDMCNFTNFDALVEEAYNNLEANIANYCFKKDVLKNLVLPLSVILDFSFITCTEHFQPLCVAVAKTIALEYIMCWGKNMNRMLKGLHSGSRAGAILAKQACNQYSKNCRKKNKEKC